MGEGEGLVVQDLVAELARVAEEGVEVGVEELLHLQREPWLQQPRHAAQPPQAPGNVAACSISLTLIGPIFLSIVNSYSLYLDGYLLF